MKCSRREQLPEPSFAIHLFDGATEIVEYLGVESCPLSPPNGFVMQKYSLNNVSVILRLCGRKPDETRKGNILLELVITGNEDTMDLPVVSWDCKTDTPIAFGDGWLVMLTNYKEVPNE